jgi:hypothetical protein
VAILALGDVGVTRGAGLGVNSVLVCRLLVTVAGCADRFRGRGIVRKTLDVSVTIHTSESAPVDGRLKVRVVHMQTDLFPILVFCQGGIAMAGEALFVAHLGSFGSSLGRGYPHHREQQSKYNNPTITLHELPSLSANQGANGRRLLSFKRPPSGTARGELPVAVVADPMMGDIPKSQF